MRLIIVLHPAAVQSTAKPQEAAITMRNYRKQGEYQYFILPLQKGPCKRSQSAHVSHDTAELKQKGHIYKQSAPQPYVTYQVCHPIVNGTQGNRKA